MIKNADERTVLKQNKCTLNSKCQENIAKIQEQLTSYWKNKRCKLQKEAGNNKAELSEELPELSTEKTDTVLPLELLYLKCVSMIENVLV